MTVNSTTDIDGLLGFINASPSPYHAAENLAQMMESEGFLRLDEKQTWQLKKGGRYFYTRSDASFVAFIVGQDMAERGLRLLGAHTDSPCLKVKPSPELNNKGYSRLGIEVYGGALLNPWFDRDLSLAGKVSGVDEDGKLVSALINFEKAIATIPSLAIHLNREANKNKSVNAQKEMNALLSGLREDFSFRDLLLAEVKVEHPELNFVEVLDFNLSFYDVQAPATIGLHDEFIASARLDNLLSCWLAADAIRHAGVEQTTVLMCNDHEEIGSRTEAGAQGTLLNDLLARLVPEAAQRQQLVRNSMMLSIDNSHGVHPNYSDKHDDNHGPLINAGPVIKFDADQSYATSSDTAAFVRWLAAKEPALALQSFVTRADMRCGSTIGPLTASNSGIKAVDIGNAQFAMHSCRELAGVDDAHTMRALLDRFIACEKIPF
ncbi:M18 family aminopeptidase [Agaribacterium haliotis]|uniref:M18 family aminopeptidase n=1 Tax=Agaribacterium haliotis TaxID=2013869 RepID=UPI000BB58AEE|nr:M18 family aminopeptidase [Agaribacterium haliotis]